MFGLEGLLLKPRVAGPQRDVPGAVQAVPVVKALVCRQPSEVFAAVPFPVAGVAVAKLFQLVGDGDFPGDEPRTGSAVIQPVRTGCRPVISAARLGVHCASTL